MILREVDFFSLLFSIQLILASEQRLCLAMQRVMSRFES